MNVLVTGGAGFIGSHLVESLINKNHQVVVVDNLATGKQSNLDKVANQISFVKADIRSPDLMSFFENIDVVYHLAALADIVPSISNPFEYIDVNVIGTTRVLEYCRQAGVKRVIYAASSSCYGIPSVYPTSEESITKPLYPYALSKLIGEEIFFHWLNLYNISGLSLRFFNVYGPRARTSGNYGAVMGVFLGQKLANLPMTIVGDGNQLRDFTYVSDVVDALVLAGKSTISNTMLNIGTGNPTTVNRLAELIGGNTINIPKRPGEPDVTHADISKAIKMLGWKPKISIDDGVNKILENLNDWLDAPQWTADQIEKETNLWFESLGRKENQD